MPGTCWRRWRCRCRTRTRTDPGPRSPPATALPTVGAEVGGSRPGRCRACPDRSPVAPIGKVTAERALHPGVVGADRDPLSVTMWPERSSCPAARKSRPVRTPGISVEQGTGTHVSRSGAASSVYRPRPWLCAGDGRDQRHLSTIDPDRAGDARPGRTRWFDLDDHVALRQGRPGRPGRCRGGSICWEVGRPDAGRRSRTLEERYRRQPGDVAEVLLVMVFPRCDGCGHCEHRAPRTLLSGRRARQPIAADPSATRGNDEIVVARDGRWWSTRYRCSALQPGCPLEVLACGDLRIRSARPAPMRSHAGRCRSDCRARRIVSG